MSVLTIGRVGLDVDIDEVERYSNTGEYGRGTLRLSGNMLGDSLAVTLAVRDELVAQAETVRSGSSRCSRRLCDRTTTDS